MEITQERSVFGGFNTRLKPKNGTPPEVYSYNNKIDESSFMKEIEFLSRYDNCFDKEFFSGTCFTCGAMASEVDLKRCFGCQLVSYCSKKCQNADWNQHKMICMEFPMKDGKNSLQVFHSYTIMEKSCKVNTKIDDNISSILKSLTFSGKVLHDKPVLPIMGSKETSKEDRINFVDTVSEMQWAAFLTFTDYSDPKNHGKLSYHTDRFFLNARVCNVCIETCPEKLFDCRCCAISYCRAHHDRMQDEDHLAQCDLLYGCVLANKYLKEYQRLLIPDDLLNEANLNEGLKFEKVQSLTKYSSEKWLHTIVNLINQRLAFPLTIHYALKTLKIGKQKKALNDITSLNIHIVHKNPMLDPRIWEFFLHQLPNLKELNLTFISWRMNLKNIYNSYLPVKRCNKCKMSERIITYNIQPMRYHEYFSTNDFVEPDVVAVFGTEEEFMKPASVDVGHDAHVLASQMDMTYGKHTVVVLTDFAENEIETCMESFKDAREVSELLPVQKNPVCGFSTLRGSNFVVNLNSYVCCIQGKH